GVVAGGVLNALVPVAKVLLGLFVALIVALVAIVAASWFIFEPPSARADVNREFETSQAITSVLTAKLDGQYKGMRYLRDTHTKGLACVKADVTIAKFISPHL